MLCKINGEVYYKGIVRMIVMNKPIVSERFDVEDIRKIREYNSLRHINMTPAEIVEDTRKGVAELLLRLKESKSIKV